MGTVIVTIILVIAAALALWFSRGHFRGEGGCCGDCGGGRDRKKLNAPKLGDKQISIEGMQCDNCRNRIEHAVNRIDGVVCKVNLGRKRAKVSYSSTVDNNTLKETIEALGFRVVKIEDI